MVVEVVVEEGGKEDEFGLGDLSVGLIIPYCGIPS